MLLAGLLAEPGPQHLNMAALEVAEVAAILEEPVVMAVGEECPAEAVAAEGEARQPAAQAAQAAAASAVSLHGDYDYDRRNA